VGWLDLDLALPVHEHEPASIRVTVFICQNCGFMRMHARDVLNHNLRDGDEGPGDPEPSRPTPRPPGDTARH
jgi:hypothetical protein